MYWISATVKAVTTVIKYKCSAVARQAAINYVKQSGSSEGQNGTDPDRGPSVTPFTDPALKYRWWRVLAEGGRVHIAVIQTIINVTSGCRSWTTSYFQWQLHVLIMTLCHYSLEGHCVLASLRHHCGLGPTLIPVDVDVFIQQITSTYDERYWT